MEALFQIGKDLGALEARVRSLESHKCDCKGGRRKAVADADLPPEQREILSRVREEHFRLVSGFNQVLKEAGIADKVKIDGFTLVDVGVDRDDVDYCCMSCYLGEKSGWQYCCDFDNCSSCCY